MLISSSRSSSHCSITTSVPICGWQYADIDSGRVPAYNDISAIAVSVTVHVDKSIGVQTLAAGNPGRDDEPY